MNQDFFIKGDLNKREEDTANLPAFFFLNCIYNEDKTIEKGRPIVDIKPYLQLDTGGEGYTEISLYEATEEKKLRYPKQWRLFEDYVYPFIKTGDVKNTQSLYGLSIIELKDKFPLIYQAYCDNLRNIGVEGTLIEETGILPLSVVVELKYYGIFTCEQVLNLPEDNNIVGGKIKEIVRAYFDRMKKVEMLGQEIEKLKISNEELKEKLSKCQSKQKKS